MCSDSVVGEPQHHQLLTLHNSFHHLNRSESLLKAYSILTDPAVKILSIVFNIHAPLVNFFPHLLGPIPASLQCLQS